MKKKTRVVYTPEELERRKRKLLSKARVNLSKPVRDPRDYDDERMRDMAEMFDIPDGSGLHGD